RRDRRVHPPTRVHGGLRPRPSLCRLDPHAGRARRRFPDAGPSAPRRERELSTRKGNLMTGTANLGEEVTALPDGGVAGALDTNATVAGALAGNARSIPVVHVEAGLRSFDRTMPEEHNRVITDHVSDLLCAATEDNVRNLASEGITGRSVVRTGNTVVEAVIS